jgi:hypothetical protein
MSTVNTKVKGQNHWDLTSNTHDDCALAVLCVIRDELQTLNRLLHCHNFTNIPQKLDRIVLNTRKPKRRKKVSP